MQRGLSKVVFVSRLVGAQISRDSCKLDKARSGIRSPAPIWRWLGHGEPPVQVITGCCLCNSSAWCTSTTVNILPVNLVSTCFDISQYLPLEENKEEKLKSKSWMRNAEPFQVHLQLPQHTFEMLHFRIQHFPENISLSRSRSFVLEAGGSQQVNNPKSLNSTSKAVTSRLPTCNLFQRLLSSPHYKYTQTRNENKQTRSKGREVPSLKNWRKVFWESCQLNEIKTRCWN